MNASFQGLPTAIPARGRLSANPQWVAWEWKPNGAKPTKPPIDPRTGRYAKVDDPATWGSYEDALARALKQRLPGVGLMFTGAEGIIGGDLDSSIDEAGQFSPLAEQVLALAETYAERSPSGRGI